MGGDNSWGAQVHGAYKLLPQEYTYQIRLDFYTSDDERMEYKYERKSWSNSEELGFYLLHNK